MIYYSQVAMYLAMDWMAWVDRVEIFSSHHIQIGFGIHSIFFKNIYQDFPGDYVGWNLGLATLHPTHVVGWEYMNPCNHIPNAYKQENSNDLLYVYIIN